jgi:hypothetical protein
MHITFIILTIGVAPCMGLVVPFALAPLDVYPVIFFVCVIICNLLYVCPIKLIKIINLAFCQTEVLPQKCLAMSGYCRSICLANPHGVLQTNKVEGYFKDKYRSAASWTDS